MSSPADAIGVGLVGYGTAGRFFHAPVIRAVPGLRLAAIVQRTGDSARRDHPGTAVVGSVDDLLSMNEIELVVVATPNTSHASLARQCLDAGRHVVVDKPFTPTSAEARAVAARAMQADRLLSVYHNRRWDGDFLTLQRLFAGGSCGRPVLLESRFDRYRPQPRPGSWRERADPGSGLLFDLGPHLVDQALILFGPPQAVTADVRMERDGVAADDAFDVTLHYPRLRVRLGAAMLAAIPGPRFLLRGTAGAYIKHGLDPQEEALRAGGHPGSERWGEEPEDRWGVLTRASAEGGSSERVRTLPGDYRAFYENVRDAIRGAAPLAVTPKQAATVIRLLELAVESSRTGRTVPVA